MFLTAISVLALLAMIVLHALHVGQIDLPSLTDRSKEVLSACSCLACSRLGWVIAAETSSLTETVHAVSTTTSCGTQNAELGSITALVQIGAGALNGQMT